MEPVLSCQLLSCSRGGEPAAADRSSVLLPHFCSHRPLSPRNHLSQLITTKSSRKLIQQLLCGSKGASPGWQAAGSLGMELLRVLAPHSPGSPQLSPTAAGTAMPSPQPHTCSDTAQLHCSQCNTNVASSQQHWTLLLPGTGQTHRWVPLTGSPRQDLLCPCTVRVGGCQA